MRPLSKLEGVSGLHGGNAQEMQQFLGMVQPPEMVQLVDRLSAQLGGDPENMDMAAVDEFVHNNITLEDVQKLLGQSVSSEDFNSAVNREVSQEQMQQMLQLLNQQGGGTGR